MVSDKFIQRCFIQKLIEGESLWRRALSVADHAYAQEFTDPISEQKLYSTTLGTGYHPRRIVVLTNGGMTERILLHALCLYGLITPTDPLGEEQSDIIFLHGLHDQRWQWPIFPRFEEAATVFQLDILQAAQQRLLAEHAQKQSSAIDSAYSPDLMMQVGLSLLADAADMVMIELRLSLKDHSNVRLQSLHPPKEGSPWPQATDALGQQYAKVGFHYAPDFSRYCPDSTVHQLVLEVGVNPCQQLLRRREQYNSQESFAEFSSISEDTVWRKNFLQNAWGALDKVRAILSENSA